MGESSLSGYSSHSGCALRKTPSLTRSKCTEKNSVSFRNECVAMRIEALSTTLSPSQRPGILVEFQSPAEPRQVPLIAVRKSTPNVSVPFPNRMLEGRPQGALQATVPFPRPHLPRLRPLLKREHRSRARGVQKYSVPFSWRDPKQLSSWARASSAATVHHPDVHWEELRPFPAIRIGALSTTLSPSQRPGILVHREELRPFLATSALRPESGRSAQLCPLPEVTGRRRADALRGLLAAGSAA